MLLFINISYNRQMWYLYQQEELTWNIRWMLSPLYTWFFSALKCYFNTWKWHVHSKEIKKCTSLDSSIQEKKWVWNERQYCVQNATVNYSRATWNQTPSERNLFKADPSNWWTCKVRNPSKSLLILSIHKVIIKCSIMNCYVCLSTSTDDLQLALSLHKSQF